jgi:hypothetical protein
MTIRNMGLTPEQDTFVETGAKLKALRVQLKVGTDALEREDFIEIDEADLDGCLERLTAAPGKGAR